MSKVIIAGGGVIGLCTAYYLVKEGHEVTVIDRGDITNGTSFGNAGYVSPSHFVPLASPGIIAKGLRWMLSSSSPFYIKPRMNGDLIRWGLAFWKSATKQKVEANVPHLHALLQLSRKLQHEIMEDIGNSFRMQEIGCFMLYKQASTEKHETDLAHEAAALGIETKVFSAAEVQAMEPEVEVKVRGGILYPIDCHLHPGDFMRSMKRSLEREGVNFQLNANITGFEHAHGKVNRIISDRGDFVADEFILAPGSWLPLVAAQLGISINMQAGKGYSMTFQDMKKNLRYPAILVDDRVAMTPMGRDLRMGGTMEISGLDSPLLIKRAQSIFKAAKNYYPGLEVEFPQHEKIWSGLRPLSPDGLPYIGRPEGFVNVIVSGGHAMLGLSLAAATGKLTEEIIDGKKTSVDISAFDVNRFQ